MKKAYLILSELNNDDLNWMISVGKKHELLPGDKLIYENQQINAFYMILSGTLSVTIEALNGKELARLSSGEVVGEISLIDTQLPLATVKAIEESVVLEIPRLPLTAKLEKDMGFAARFYRGISRCLSDRMRGTVLRLGYDVELDALESREQAANSTGNIDLELVQAKFNWLKQLASH
ncbi:MAG TPA: cyclic nucleotide-binding domain-containing protein [Oscillatoriales cyanobacterium M59_W2019_021]|nr:MAG: cyclic nucleotide-binding protein [Cyanobacteria bacterium J055]HIK33063.1 cyclic nucleotide-binding domain-containing protein [Oscillatoriales cyanobacterium M4454_W2019_049]HIK49562.1 cyclic nucleotide-binding domain-containing protein [Oscillatoriales cyanobacterium M59_W2019_021]